MCVMRDLLTQFSGALRTQAEGEALTTVLAQFFDFHPLPAWIKVVDVDGHVRMFRTNAAYNRATGKDYQPGQHDADHWTDDAAEQFSENDRRVIQTRAPVETKELAPDAQGVPVLWAGAKWPIFSPTGEVIAVAGFAVAEQHLAHAD